MRLPSLLRALLQHPSPKAPPQEPTMAAAAPTPEAESLLARVSLECGGDISASQEEVLANSAFLGGDNALAASQDEDEEEVFATPPDATQQQQQEDDAVVTMCTLPFTPTPSKTPKPPSGEAHPPLPHSSKSNSPAPPLSFDAAPDDDDAPLANPSRKPRVGTRKVRGARIRTPTPTPSPSPSPEQQQQQPEQQPQEEQQPQAHPEQQPTDVDPLVRAVLMIPTKTTVTAATTTSSDNPVEDFLALCRRQGLI